jgi:hypothetical protein
VIREKASVRIVALAIILAGTVWQPLRAEEFGLLSDARGSKCFRMLLV